MNKEITRFNAQTKDEPVGNIYRSYNYKQFNLNKINRKISQKHVNEIVMAIKAHKAQLPIIQVNPKMEIIDGQHRFAALQSLGLPIYYYVDRQSGDESIIQINSKQSRWHLPQFIHARAKQGVEGYEELERLIKNYNRILTPSGVVVIFSGKADWGGGSTSKVVQQGEFKFGDKEKAIAFLDGVIEAENNLSRKKQLTNAAVVGLWSYYNHPLVNHKKLFSLINDDFVTRIPRNKNGMMEFIGKAYNKHVQKNKIPFYIDQSGKFNFANS